jgi:serine/threonine protein kinase
MLTFDPKARITVLEALEHPWLASYHDVDDEPECAEKFEKWRVIEKLETLEDFREVLWNEIEDYRREVRGLGLDFSTLGSMEVTPSNLTPPKDDVGEVRVELPVEAKTEVKKKEEEEARSIERQEGDSSITPPVPTADLHRPPLPADPVVTYSRRPSIIQPSRRGSAFPSPQVPHQTLPSYTEGPLISEPGPIPPGSTFVFPSTNTQYVLPARSRTTSTAGAEVTRKLLRTLSTVSIHESAEGLAGGLAGIAPIGKYIVEKQTTGADAPASEMPQEFGIDEGSEDEEDGNNDRGEKKDKGKENRFRLESA